MDTNPRNWNLAQHSDEEYDNSQVFTSNDNKAGFAITPEGDLVNVFNNGGVKGAGKKAVIQAVKAGAKTLDCYDPFLPKFYTQFGFIETGRMRFNDEYAPEGWDFETQGRPDIVFMAWNGKNRDTVEQDYGTYTYKPTTNYFEDWDVAKSLSREMAK